MQILSISLKRVNEMNEWMNEFKTPEYTCDNLELEIAYSLKSLGFKATIQKSLK